MVNKSSLIVIPLSSEARSISIARRFAVPVSFAVSDSQIGAGGRSRISIHSPAGDSAGGASVLSEDNMCTDLTNGIIQSGGTPTPNPAHRMKGLEDSKIPPAYYCKKCGIAVDAHYTAGGMMTHHTTCKSLVVANPEYVAYRAGMDDFSDLLEDN